MDFKPLYLCRDKHVVGDILFYKHIFLVSSELKIEKKKNHGSNFRDSPVTAQMK